MYAEDEKNNNRNMRHEKNHQSRDCNDISPQAVTKESTWPTLGNQEIDSRARVEIGGCDLQLKISNCHGLKKAPNFLAGFTSEHAFQTPELCLQMTHASQQEDQCSKYQTYRNSLQITSPNVKMECVDAEQSKDGNSIQGHFFTSQDQNMLFQKRQNETLYLHHVSHEIQQTLKKAFESLKEENVEKLEKVPVKRKPKKSPNSKQMEIDHCQNMLRDLKELQHLQERTYQTQRWLLGEQSYEIQSEPHLQENFVLTTSQLHNISTELLRKLTKTKQSLKLEEEKLQFFLSKYEADRTRVEQMEIDYQRRMVQLLQELQFDQEISYRTHQVALQEQREQDTLFQFSNRMLDVISPEEAKQT